MNRFRLFLVLAVCFLSLQVMGAEKGAFLGGVTVEHPDWFRDSFLDLPEDVAELAEQNQGLAIYFYQNGCPYCAKLINTNFQDPQLVTRLQKSYQVIAINMWGDRDVVDLDGTESTEKKMAARWKVQFTPTFIFLDRTGRVAIRINGYRNITSFNAALDYLEAHPMGDISYQQYFKNHPPKQDHPLITEPFLSSPPYTLNKNNGYQVVLFESSSCKECPDFHRTLKSPHVVKQFKRLTTTQLSVNKDTPVITPAGKQTTAREWADELGVDYIPSLIIFSPDKHIVIRKEGMLKAFHTEGILEYALSGAWKTQPSFQRFLEHYADTERDKGRDIHLWKD